MDPTKKPYKFVVRLPLQLRHQIADAAQYYKRSMNSEIVARLEHTFSGLNKPIENKPVASDIHQTFETLFGRALNAEEERIVHAYRRLSDDKKKALLQLLD